MNVLYFSPYPSHPLAHGNSSNIFQFASRFQELGHKVHFALLDLNYPKETLLDVSRAWDSLDLIPFANPMWPDDQDIPFDAWYEEGLGEKIAALCGKHEIDVLFCSYVMHSKMLEYVPASILKVIDTHDKMSDRYAMLRANGLPTSSFSCTPEDEGAYLRRADVVIARREEETRFFNQVSQRNSAITVPYFEKAKFLDRDFPGLEKVGTVASNNPANLAFTKEFLLSIDRKLAGGPCPFSVHVAGQLKGMVRQLPDKEAEIFRRPWVHMLGFVDDIGDFYRDMDLIASPVTIGTGINVKTVQAMAYGMPLLSTAWGVKGIETEEPRHLYQTMDALVEGLFELKKQPDELDHLAAVSRNRYMGFLAEGTAALQSIFSIKKS